jgi:hypothetical protein
VDGRRWLVIDASWLLLVPEALTEKKVTRADAERVVRDALLTVDFVAAAYTRSQLEEENAPAVLGAGVVLSFNRARSGDVFYQTKPYWVDRPGFGSNHGSPYNYDTHVPLLWYGVGVTPGRRTERVGVDDLAPTLAHILGVTAPPQSRGRILF